MKKLITVATMVFLLIPFVAVSQQIKNAVSDTVRISGNCNMCKRTIEKAGHEKGVAKVEWDEASKTASLTYDSVKISKDEILKRIALAGYDNEGHLAPDDVYSNLHHCCQYDRELKNKKVKASATKVTRQEH